MSIAREVQVSDILLARDARVEMQNHFLKKYHLPLVSFTMNIPGSIKTDDAIERAFQIGIRRILMQIDRRGGCVADTYQKIEFTGCEQMWAVDRISGEEMKKAMMQIEDQDALGRLFDIDVIDVNGGKLSREAWKTERGCLICGKPVRACARNRSHAAEELFARVHEIIDDYFDRQDVEWIAECAQRALLTEAAVTPKPGLVDRENSGAHRDMDLLTFVDSACALRPYFRSCAEIGRRERMLDPEQIFKHLRYQGVLAEEKMYAATGGVNTHKGAIFSLGILCCAAAMSDGDEILNRAADIAQESLEDLKTIGARGTVTAGEQQFLECGLAGARGEAAAGFPSVRNIALPTLEWALSAGRTINDAALEALVALMANVEDSNIIKRGGFETARWVRTEMGRLAGDKVDPAALRAWNDRFVQLNLSPGGCADLLAVTLFVWFIKNETKR